MPRSMSANLKAHFAQSVTTRARLLRLQRRDGTILGLTALDRDITYDDGRGNVIYRADIGGVRTAIDAGGSWDADQLEIALPQLSGVLTATEARARRWHNAAFDVMEVNYRSLGDGHVTLFSGRVSDVLLRDNQVVLRARSLKAAFGQELPLRIIKAGCPFDFGDADCGFPVEPPVRANNTAHAVRDPRNATIGATVRPETYLDRHFECAVAGISGVAPPAWNLALGGLTVDGSVTWITRQAATIEAMIAAVASNSQFTLVYSGDAPDAWLTGGMITFVDGPNAGLAVEVETWTLATKTIVLWKAAPFLPVAGNAVKVTARCAKDRSECKARRNIHRHGGFLNVPGEDSLFRVVQPSAQN